MDKIILILSFSTLTASICMTVYAFLQTPSREQKYTLLMAVANFIMCIGNVLCTGSKTFEAAEVGLHIMFLGGPFIPFCFLLMSASICRYKINQHLLGCLVIINLTFSSLMFRDSSLKFMYRSVEFYRIGDTNFFVRETGFLFHFYFVLIAGYLLAVFTIITRTRKQKPALYKNLRSTLRGFYVSGLAAMSMFLVTYALRLDVDLTCYGTTIAFGYFYYALHLNNIYNIQQSTAEYIINDLDDILIAHDNNFNYEFSNKTALNVFSILNDYPYNTHLTGIDEELDKMLALKDGDFYTRNEKEYLCRVIPIDENDRITGYIRWLHNETTEREYMRRILELKEEAEHANAAKSTFLAHVSHEIRTPINAVIGMNELIVRETTEPSISAYANQSMRAGKILLALINDILDFSKIEAGKMELVPSEYFTSDMIDDIVTMTQFRAEEKNLEFKVNIDENIPDSLIGDETRVKQIITNIVTNGVKYTEEGSVTLSVSYDENGCLKVIVSDTGIGIRQEDMSKLYESFERIENSVTHKTEGTGLGMSIVCSLLNAMKGHMDVESVYGEGSTFTLYIPQEKGTRRRVRSQKSLAGTGRLADIGKNVYNEDGNKTGKAISAEEPSLASPQDISKAGPTRTYAQNTSPDNSPAGLNIDPNIRYTAPSANIIIVDDTRTNLFVAESLLKRTKIHIDTAISGKAFLELAMKNKYDLILIDYNMPGMNGVEAANALRASESPCASAPIIMMTAESDPKADELFKANGLSYTLSKPLDPKYYEAFIAALLPKEKVIQ